MVKKVLFIIPLCGNPKDTFETPRLVLIPIFVSLSIHSSVTSADELSELMVIAKGSIIIFSLLMLYFFALSIIFCAISILPSAVCGIPRQA